MRRELDLCAIIASLSLPAAAFGDTTVEWLGHEQIIHTSAGPTPIAVRDVTGQAHAPPGSAVHLAIDPARLHLFDSHGGERLREAVG